MSLVERVKEQVKQIVKDELSRLEDKSKYCETIVKETSEKINRLIDSYAILEKTLGEMHILGLAGITSDTAKVVALRDVFTSLPYPYGNMMSVRIIDINPFREHPSGSDFKLDPKKHYKFLAAFIPVEEK